MQTRRIATQHVSSIGLGCMNLSHAYGVPPSAAQAESVLLGALDVGITLLDTAALYGFGANEELLGKVLSGQRHRYMLASKCGIFQENGRRVIDGRPATIKKTCEDSLRRLRTDVIDLYYLHRWDKQVPIEDSVGALSELVTAGKFVRSGCQKCRRQRSEKRTLYILSLLCKQNIHCGHVTQRSRCWMFVANLISLLWRLVLWVVVF